MALSGEVIVGVVGVIMTVVVAVPGITVVAWRWRKRQLDQHNSEASDSGC